MRRFSITCSGACTTTCPIVESFAARAPADLVEVTRGEDPVLSPSNRHSLVKSTVRMGMFTPTPSVSVPHHDLEEPGLRELLDEQAVLGQEPRVVHADAVLKKRATSLP